MCSATLTLVRQVSKVRPLLIIVDDLIERTGLAELELPPLDEVTAGRLMSSVFPLLSAHTRRRLLADAGGNPLAVLELARVRSRP